MQSDPIGLIRRKRPSAMLKAGLFDAQLNNLYSYTESNPILFDDFYGLSTTVVLENILGGAGVGGARGSSRGIIGAIAGAGIGAAMAMCEKNDREKCEALCDADATRGAAFCHAMAAMHGRKGTRAYARVYQQCIAQVDANLIECYQDCAKESK